MPLTYSLLSNANGKYALSGRVITVAAALSAGTDVVTIRATDGNGWSKDFDLTITVTSPAPSNALTSKAGSEMLTDKSQTILTSKG